MEGKALLFKFLGGVDAFPIPIRAASPGEFLATVEAISPAFGGINLEDIASPEVLRDPGGARETARDPRLA